MNAPEIEEIQGQSRRNAATKSWHMSAGTQLPRNAAGRKGAALQQAGQGGLPLIRPFLAENHRHGFGKDHEIKAR